jgi:hypothetical protein
MRGIKHGAIGLSLFLNSFNVGRLRLNAIVCACLFIIRFANDEVSGLESNLPIKKYWFL